MVLWGLWMARRHLVDVLRKAWNPGFPLDDSRELISYRTAVQGLFLGVFYMLGWLYRAGMPLLPGGFLLACILIAYLGITRVVIQTGVYYVTTPIVGQAMTMTTFGTNSITAPGLAGMGLTYSFFGDVQSIFMPAVAHAARLHDTMNAGRRSLAIAIASAVLVGFIASIGCIIVMGYLHGASNFRSWFFQVSSGAGVRAFEAVLGKIISPETVDMTKLTYFGSGAVMMVLLTIMHYRFSWWPLHPVGLSISSVWMIRNQAVAIFVVWGIKSLILRFGGIGMYRRAMPFFIGLIAGHFLAVGVSFIVDMIFFPGVGHPILHG
jgi:hypothetical protein